MSMSNAVSHLNVSQENFQERLRNNISFCEALGERNFQTRGLWYGENPTDYVFFFFMFQIVLSFLISRLLYFVLRPLKQPKFVCDMLTGIILGPSILGRDEKSMEKIFLPKNMLLSNTVSTMGAIYFIFINAVKMDKSRILLTTKKVWNVSVTCFFVPFIITTCLLFLLQNYLSGFSQFGSFFIYISITESLSRYPNITDALSELNLLSSELGQLAMSAVMLHEILAGFLILTAMLGMPGNLKKAIVSQLCSLVLIVFIVLVLRPFMLWIIRVTPEGKPVKGVYIKLILLAPLVTGMLSDAAGATFVPGAQILGLIIPAGPPLGSAVVEKSEFIMSQLFLPFFYIRIGQQVNVFSIKDSNAFGVLMFILTVASLGKVVGSLLSLLCFNTGLRNAFLLAFIMEIRGVIEFCVFLYWRVRNFVDESFFSAFVIAAIAVNAIVTPLIKIFYKKEMSLEACNSSTNRPRTLQSQLLAGEFLVLCCIHCEDNVNGMITLLKASNPTEASPICAYALHLTQLVGRAEPLLAPYKSQKRISQPNSTDRIMRALSKFSKTSGLPIIIQLMKVIAPYKTMHQTICKLARDKLIPLVIVPFPESLEFHGRRASLRSFNINVQTYAPCTVGILVDRSSQCHLGTSHHFSYNVMIFFFGGPDDREALSLALRMSGHPGVSITMVRIDLRTDADEDSEGERLQDEALINEFKTKNMGNACVVCHDVAAEETALVMNTIRSVDSSCDLVVVGKHQNSRLAKEMLSWVEYKELGVVGDMVASSDFCGGTMSVLVMHCLRHGTGSCHTRTESFLMNSDARSAFSFSSSNCDRDNDEHALVVTDH